MVLDIQEYKQQNNRVVEKIICKNGFFYVDKKDLDIINQYTFEVHPAGGQTTMTTPRASFKIDGAWHSVTFAQLYCLKYYGELHPKGLFIDHKNGSELDNVSSNMNLVNIQQNGYNQFKQGYTINFSGGLNGATHTNYFATVAFRDMKQNKKVTIRPYSRVFREDEVAKQQYDLENSWFKKHYPDLYYPFDFIHWRRNDLYFLQLEREGLVTEKDAIRLFLMQDKFRLNPWYWCRFNLFNLYKKFGITYPQEGIDWYINQDGEMCFMNGELCRPFKRGINQNRVN